MSQNCLYSDVIPGASHWSFILKKGITLKLTDIEGGANVGMLFYNPTNFLERYNAPDTLKCQHTFKLTQGHCLYSDMGRIFCSIVEDSLGWHDTVCGNTNKKMVRDKYGEKNYQQARNARFQNGVDAFLVELAKYGLGKKDLAANLNLFSKVATDEDGNLAYDSSAAKAGANIYLRFEMDTLVILHTCPHPLNPASEFSSRPIEYQLLKSSAVEEDDFCVNSCEENKRGFQNTLLYNLTQAGVCS